MVSVQRIAFWIKVIIIATLLLLLSQVTSVILPVALSVIAAFTLNPLVNLITGILIWPFKRRLFRGPAILLAFIIFIVFFAGIFMFVVLPFISEFNKFAKNLPAFIIRAKYLAANLQERAYTVSTIYNLQILIDQLVTGLAAYFVEFARRMINAIVNFMSQAIQLIVVPVLTYYFLKDWQQLHSEFLQLFSATSRIKIDRIIEEMAIVVSSYIRGQFLVSIIMGVMVFCGMYSLGVEYPLVLGLFATLTEAVPIIGPIIGAVPGIMLALLMTPILGIKVIIFYIIAHQLENHIIVPKIMGHTIALHPVLVIISLLIGGQLFGIIGMLAAVPATALLKVLARHAWYLEEEGGKTND